MWQGEILEKVRASQKVLLLLDYDGTLVRIHRHPSLALLTAKQKNLLQRLANIPQFRVGILSGRGLADLKKTVGVAGVVYAANHGLEIAYGKNYWVHPKAKESALLIYKLVEELRPLLRRYRGVWVENKVFSIAIHYRQFKGRPMLLRKQLTKSIELYSSRFWLSGVKQIFEIRPAVNWGKGKALLSIIKLLKFQQRPLVIFIGDDETDEDAFLHMSKTDISILFGKKRTSHAQYHCYSAVEVVRFLALLEYSAQYLH